MSDREEKLRAAREKLDKFRRKRSNMDSPSPVPSQTSQKVKINNDDFENLYNM